jgi:hypothetical protein
MKWTAAFIDAARKCKCRIINYPEALERARQIMGTTTFDLKKIQQTTFETFVPSLVEAQKPGASDPNVMAIVAWDEGTYWSFNA